MGFTGGSSRNELYPGVVSSGGLCSGYFNEIKSKTIIIITLRMDKTTFEGKRGKTRQTKRIEEVDRVRGRDIWSRKREKNMKTE